MYKYEKLALSLETPLRRLRACNDMVYCLSIQSGSGCDGHEVSHVLYLLNEVLDKELDTIEQELFIAQKEETPT